VPKIWKPRNYIIFITKIFFLRIKKLVKRKFFNSVLNCFFYYRTDFCIGRKIIKNLDVYFNKMCVCFKTDILEEMFIIFFNNHNFLVADLSKPQCGVEI
jgi:hypothetical protein